jgi:hypothetical protein
MENIKDKLVRVGELAGSGDALEHDLALEMLRAIYAEIKFGKYDVQVETTVVTVAEDKSNEIIDTAVWEGEDCQITEVMPEPDSESASESVPLPEPEPTTQEEEFPSRRRVASEVIRSLYGDAPVKKLGDVAGDGRQVLGETLQGNKKDMASHLAASGRRDLKHSIGINDKFLMVRDMFDGDSKTFNDTITYLDTFTDLDEAIIYIHETYNWSADSDGVKLIVELLERKLG